MSSILLSKFSVLVRPNILNNFIPLITCENTISTTAANLAARRGTRERKNKKKVKAEIKTVGWIPENLRKKIIRNLTNKHLDDQQRKAPVDDVFGAKYFRTVIYSVAEAIECYKQSHHPTMFNCMNAKINIKIELNMIAEKSTRIMDNFYGAALLPHSFDSEMTKSILVLCADKEVQDQAIAAGASHAGGKELVKKIQEGEVSLKEYDFFATQPTFMNEIISLRGLMKKRFPNTKTGTINTDVVKMVKSLLNALEYKALKDEHQPDFGSIEIAFGTVNMDTQQLVENCSALLKHVDGMRPKRSGKFITRCFLTSPPSNETIRVNPFEFVESGEAEESTSEDEGNDNESDMEDEKDDVKAKVRA